MEVFTICTYIRIVKKIATIIVKIVQMMNIRLKNADQNIVKIQNLVNSFVVMIKIKIQ